MPVLKEEKYNFVKRILARLTKIKNKSFSDAVQNIIKAFEDKALQTNSFFTKNLGRVDLEQKNKLVTIFEKAKTSQSSNELEHNIIKWVLINTGGKSSSDEDSDNEWLFNDKKVIRSNLFTDVTRNKKRLKNYFTQLEALENDFEEINNNNRDEEKYYQLVLAILCLFILEKKNIFIKLAQEKAAQEEAARGKAVRGKAIRGKAVRGKAIRGKAVRGKAVREEAVREKTAQEEAAQENKSPLVDPESNSKNISHPSSPNLQKKENKNLPPEAEKGLLPISSQEMMTKKVSDEIAHQKDNSLTTQLTNSGHTPLHSETSIDDNPTKLDKDNENETIEHRLDSPTQKNKIADSNLAESKNLNYRPDIEKYKFETLEHTTHLDLEEKLNHDEEIINNALDTQGEDENKLGQLENSVLIPEKNRGAEKDSAAYSTPTAKIESETNQDDKADTEKLDASSFEEHKLTTEDQTSSHQSTQEEIAIKSSKVSIDQPDIKRIDFQKSETNQDDKADTEKLDAFSFEEDELTTEDQTSSHQSTQEEIAIKSSKVSIDQPDIKRIDLQKSEEGDRKNLQQDNNIFPIEQETNNNPETINVNLELQETKKPSSLSFMNKDEVTSSLRKLDNEISSIIQEEKELEASRDELTKYLKNLISTFDINNEDINNQELNIPLIEEITEEINSLDQHIRKLKNQRAELETKKKDYQDLADILSFKKYSSLTANSIIDQHDDFDLDNYCNLSWNTDKNSDSDPEGNNEETENLEWDPEWDMEKNSPSDLDVDVEHQEQRTRESSPPLTEDEDQDQDQDQDQENKSQQRNNQINETIAKHHGSSEIQSTSLEENTSKEADSITIQLPENNTDSPITTNNLDSREQLPSQNNPQFEQQEKISSQPALPLTEDEDQENKSQQRNNITNQSEEKDKDNTQLAEKIPVATEAQEQLKQQITALESEIRQNKDLKETLQVELDELKKLNQEINEKYDQQELEVKQLNKDLDEYNQHITKLEDKLKEAQINKKQYSKSNEHKSVQTAALTNEGIERKIGHVQSQSATDDFSIADNKELQNNSEDTNTMGQGSSKKNNDHERFSTPLPPEHDNADSHPQFSDSDSESENPRAGNSRQFSTPPPLNGAANDSDSSQPSDDLVDNHAGSRRRLSGSDSESESGQDNTNPSNPDPAAVANPATRPSPDKKDWLELKEGRKKNVPLFNFKDQESSSGFANIIASQINKNHCDDITELNEFKPSDDFNKTLRSNPVLRETIDEEKKRLENEFKTALFKFWQGCAQCQTNDALKQVESSFNEQIKKIKPKKLKDLWDEIPTNQEEISDEYSHYIDSALASTQDKTLKAGNPQTSPLLNQLKVKILRAGFTSAEQAEQAFEKGAFIEKGKEEEKLKIINLQQGDVDPPSQTPERHSFKQDEVEDLILDIIEKRLPLDFIAETYLNEELEATIISIGFKHHSGPEITLGLLIMLLINLIGNKEDEQMLTDAFVSIIDKNNVKVDPETIQLALKQKKEDSDKVLRPRSSLQEINQLKIEKANQKKKEEIKDELIEHSKPTNCFAITSLSGG